MEVEKLNHKYGSAAAAHSYSWPVCHVGKLGAAAATYHQPISAYNSPKTSITFNNLVEELLKLSKLTTNLSQPITHPKRCTTSITFNNLVEEL